MVCAVEGRSLYWIEMTEMGNLDLAKFVFNLWLGVILCKICQIGQKAKFWWQCIESCQKSKFFTCDEYLYSWWVFVLVMSICTRDGYLYSWWVFVLVMSICTRDEYLYSRWVFVLVMSICTLHIWHSLFKCYNWNGIHWKLIHQKWILDFGNSVFSSEPSV
jgi:hypothetical protein